MEKKKLRKFKVQRGDGTWKEVEAEHYLLLAAGPAYPDGGMDMYFICNEVHSQEEAERWQRVLAGLLRQKHG